MTERHTYRAMNQEEKEYLFQHGADAGEIGEDLDLGFVLAALVLLRDEEADRRRVRPLLKNLLTDERYRNLRWNLRDFDEETASIPTPEQFSEEVTQRRVPFLIDSLTNLLDRLKKGLAKLDVTALQHPDFCALLRQKCRTIEDQFTLLLMEGKYEQEIQDFLNELKNFQGYFSLIDQGQYHQVLGRRTFIYRKNGKKDLSLRFPRVNISTLN